MDALAAVQEVSNQLSVNENSIGSVRVVPNPFQEFIHIRSNTQIDGVTIFSILGKEVLSVDGDIRQIDVASLRSGMYFVKIR